MSDIKNKIMDDLAEYGMQCYRDGKIAGRADAEEDAENRMNRILDDEKRLSYEQGIADAIDEFADLLKKKVDEDAERFNTYTFTCIDEVAEQLKEQNNG